MLRQTVRRVVEAHEANSTGRPGSERKDRGHKYDAVADDLIGPGLAIDETAHLRKGNATACVAPQHADVTGKVENCVTWVFTALVTCAVPKPA